jgi:ATP-dependent DNA helicase RecG
MRAAMLLFHSDPEKYVTGASVKIAYFAPEGAYGYNKSDDIIYHDEIHGPLMLQADKVVDLVYTKYLKALVSYDGLQRVETYLTPKEAFREIVLNAINHKLYETGNPIQISVYEDRIVVFNQGYWPEDIDLTDLYTKKHSSYPHNPNIAKAFFNAGEIEAYGSGFSKIKIICDEMEAPYPELEITKNGVTVVIKACERYMNLLNHGRYWKTYPDNKEKIVDFLETESGEIITDNNGAALVVETEKDVDSSVIASIDHMMEILAVELSESEKELYLPIAEYLKTHDTIRNSDVQHLLNRGDSTSNRYLKRLVELGVLIPEGNNKGRVYKRAPGDKS